MSAFKKKPIEYTMNGIDLYPYRHHPRVLEFKFTFLFDRFVRDFGIDGAMDSIEGLCIAAKCDVTKVRAIINRTPEIKKVTPRNTLRYFQEGVFLGYLEGLSLMKASDKFAGKRRGAIYGKELYKIHFFLNKEWLDILDSEPVLCGVQTYRIELERLMDYLERLKLAV